MARSDHARDGQSEPEAAAEADDASAPAVNTRIVSEDRTVFTEDGNPDGWISTDLTVDSRP